MVFYNADFLFVQLVNRETDGEKQKERHRGKRIPYMHSFPKCHSSRDWVRAKPKKQELKPCLPHEINYRCSDNVQWQEAGIRSLRKTTGSEHGNQTVLPTKPNAHPHHILASVCLLATALEVSEKLIIYYSKMFSFWHLCFR